MATVLVSVALVAASIWIAIRMESGLDSPAARALPADTGPGDLPWQRQPLLLPVPAPPVSGAGQRPAIEGDRPA